MELEIKKLDPAAQMPRRAHEGDAGLDLHALKGTALAGGSGTVISTGLAMAIPPGHVGLVADRSSLARRGIKTAGGVIDSGYRGEIGVVLWNLSPEVVELKAGDRVAQLLILPVISPPVTAVDALSATSRGEGGFGSTGA